MERITLSPLYFELPSSLLTIHHFAKEFLFVVRAFYILEGVTYSVEFDVFLLCDTRLKTWYCFSFKRRFNECRSVILTFLPMEFYRPPEVLYTGFNLLQVSALYMLLLPPKYTPESFIEISLWSL